MNIARLTSMKKYGMLLGVFVFFFLMISAVSHRWNAEVVEVEIKVIPTEDNQLLISERDVKNLLELANGDPLEGAMYENISVEELELALETNSFVENADVYLDAKSHLLVEIHQRLPILRIIDRNNQQYYLDKTGAKVPVSKHGAARVLVATGNIPPYQVAFQDKKKNVLKDLFELTNYILSDPYRAALVEQIYVENGEFTLVPKIGNQQIELGGINDLEEKFEKLFIFYEEAMPREGWQKYKTINVKYKDQVVCRRRSSTT